MAGSRLLLPALLTTTLVVVVVVVVAVVVAAAQSQARRELGGFSLQLPPGVTQQAGGIDSHAGRLVGDALRIDYDRGIHADPLMPREGITGREERAVVVDGRPARLVSWRVEQPAPARYFIGLHVPQAGESVMGAIRLTLLAQVPDSARLADAEALLLSLRLTPQR